MFNNLIESNSHAKEYKRRGSFLLITTATYAVLLVLGGVASIYAYDAHLDAQTTELGLIGYIEPRYEEPVRINSTPVRPASNPRNAPSTPTRPELIDSTLNPHNMPERIGIERSPVPPAPPGATRGPVYDPPAPSFAGRGVVGGSGNTPLVNIPDPPPLPPPPPPTPTPVKVLKISRVLNSQAISLPKPTYSPMAKQIRIQGVVAVQVLIDETGKVVSAKAVSGHPLLVPESVRAAMQARFSPTIIGDSPVKVSGVITYNFVMQ